MKTRVFRPFPDTIYTSSAFLTPSRGISSSFISGKKTRSLARLLIGSNAPMPGTRNPSPRSASTMYRDFLMNSRRPVPMDLYTTLDGTCQPETLHSDGAQHFRVLETDDERFLGNLRGCDRAIFRPDSHEVNT